MALFELIDNDQNLQPFLRAQCSENAACVKFSNNFNDSDPLNGHPGHVRILKIDTYFQSLRYRQTLAGVDCLILAKSKDGHDIALVELKDTVAARGINWPHVVKKFQNSVNHYLNGDFSHVFTQNNVRIERFRTVISATYLVNHETVDTRLLSLARERLALTPPMRFLGKVSQLMIEPSESVIF